MIFIAINFIEGKRTQENMDFLRKTRNFSCKILKTYKFYHFSVGEYKYLFKATKEMVFFTVNFSSSFNKS